MGSCKHFTCRLTHMLRPAVKLPFPVVLMPLNIHFVLWAELPMWCKKDHNGAAWRPEVFSYPHFSCWPRTFLLTVVTRVFLENLTNTCLNICNLWFKKMSDRDRASEYNSDSLDSFSLATTCSSQYQLKSSDSQYIGAQQNCITNGHYYKSLHFRPPFKW